MLLRIPAAVLILAVSAAYLDAEDQKPVCNAESAGHMWPEAANHDPKLFKKMVRCGELEVCTRGRWHYRWESPTVRIDQLPGGSGLSKPAGCEILPDDPEATRTSSR